MACHCERLKVTQVEDKHFVTVHDKSVDDGQRSGRRQVFRPVGVFVSAAEIVRRGPKFLASFKTRYETLGEFRYRVAAIVVFFKHWFLNSLEQFPLRDDGSGRFDG